MAALCCWANVRDMQSLIPHALVLALVGCADDDKLAPPPPLSLDVDSGGPEVQDTGAEPCIETADGTIPEEAEWMSFDRAGSALYSTADGVLDEAWVGSEGTYDLNTVAKQGANGFKLDRPGQVVGVAVRWDNLPESPEPIPVHLWPDFGSDGYMWDVENPLQVPTRCLSSEDEGEWVQYLLPEPISVPDMLHVFAGYSAEEGGAGPQLMFESYRYDGDPPFAGIRFLGVEDGTYYLGMAQPWYTWQVRLAVVYDAPLAEDAKPFQADDELPGAGRMAWGDYDNDGDDDVMVGGPTLYRNNGDGTFTDVSSEVIETTGSSGGGVWGDYDNDGCLDYFGQNGGYASGDVLLHNDCEGRLVDVTSEAGIDDTQDTRDCDGDDGPEHSPTEGVAWADIDGDGLLDLYMANYECSSEFDFFKNYDDFLWRNNGDGTFSDWTEMAGLDQTNQAGRGVTTGDPDLDGDTDLFVSNYRLDRNFFYENDGAGGLDDISSSNGTRGVQVSGAYGHTIGAQFGDVDNDGDLDMVHANLAHPFYYHFSDLSMVLINDGSGTFTNEAEARGLVYRETHSNPTLFDADNDGDLDLFITAIYGGRDSDFYRNDGLGHFVLENYASGLVVQNGWGSAVSDYDHDGDLDMLSRTLHRNEHDNDNHWLQVRLVGGAGAGGLANRSAIGATIELTAASTDQLRQISGGSGTSVQDSLVAHFGLGLDDEADLHVLFPGGATVDVDGVAADQRIWIHEDGRTHTGFTPPAW